MNRRGFISLLAGSAGAFIVPWRQIVVPHYSIVFPARAAKLQLVAAYISLVGPLAKEFAPNPSPLVFEVNRYYSDGSRDDKLYYTVDTAVAAKGSLEIAPNLYLPFPQSPAEMRGVIVHDDVVNLSRYYFLHG